MVEYSSDIIQEHADKLYERAKSILASYTITGGLLGFLPFSALALIDSAAVILAIFLGALGAWIGWEMAKEKAFQLRLQAQLALCQRQTEENTRH